MEKENRKVLLKMNGKLYWKSSTSKTELDSAI
jgi:hypothetical protein